MWNRRPAWRHPDDRPEVFGRQARAAHAEQDDISEAVTLDSAGEREQSVDRAGHQGRRIEPAETVRDFGLYVLRVLHVDGCRCQRPVALRSAEETLALRNSWARSLGSRRLLLRADMCGITDNILFTMARGFESKDVEFQQTEAADRSQVPRRSLTPEERDRAVQRHSIELALTRARSDLAAATSPIHRHMLEQGIAELERQLAQ
jgi:hypothetical protein